MNTRPTGKVSKAINLLANEASKVSLLRRCSDALARRYASKVEGDPRRMRFLAGHPGQWARQFWQRLAFWHSAPAHFSGGMLLNLLGLQILRHRLHAAQGARERVAAPFTELQEQGVMRVAGLLSEDALHDVQSFYSKHAARSKVYLPDFSELIIYSNLLAIENENFNDPAFKSLRNMLVRELDLPNLFKAMSGTELRAEPFVSILRHSYIHGGSHKPQQDGNNLPHRDVFYASYKIFIYLNDVSEDNAAFIYYPGTHANGADSALDIYKSSLRYYLVNAVPIGQ